MVLRILIVGGGIAGQAAGLALRRAGHHVQIFEKSHLTPTDTSGAVVHLGPKSNDLVRSWGVDEAVAAGVLTKEITELNRDGSPKESDSISPPGWMYYGRSRLHRGLQGAATASMGAGVPVELHLGAEVLAVDCNSASVALRDGRDFVGDVVVGADGFESTVRKMVTSYDSIAVPDQKIAVQLRLHAHSGPFTERFRSHPERYEKWAGTDLELNVYSIEPGQLLLDCTLPAQAGTEVTSPWIKDQLVQAFAHEQSELTQLLGALDAEDIHSWTQAEYPRVQKWTSEKAVLVGDAAHPFLPHEHPGTSQSLNDALALASELASDVEVEQVKDRLVAWEGPRKERLKALPCYYASTWTWDS
ncbi:hypothetical protein BJY01DRAFT_247252 [Aspergillus pseudoustus]|uniref:FAD-binding domain-containing protein n=1 Tax=Aspergillus pseudoustus TaxID=1810923 RepID=A0ABR4K2B5_9EURO